MEELISEYRVELFRGGKIFPVQVFKNKTTEYKARATDYKYAFYGHIDIYHDVNKSGTELALIKDKDLKTCIRECI